MKDRGMKKWQPFNAVASAKEILNTRENVKQHILSNDEVAECEELLKNSLYTHSCITITYIDNAKICVLIDYVINIDPISKNITFSQKKINFRQIIKVETN